MNKMQRPDKYNPKYLKEGTSIISDYKYEKDLEKYIDHLEKKVEGLQLLLHSESYYEGLNKHLENGK